MLLYVPNSVVVPEMVLKNVSMTTNCVVKDVELMKILGDVEADSFIIENIDISDTELGDTTTTTERSLLTLQGSYKNLKIQNFQFTTNIIGKYFTCLNIASSDLTSITLDGWTASGISMDNGFSLFKFDTDGVTETLDI